MVNFILLYFHFCNLMKCFLGNCFGPDGIDEIRNILENKSFLNQMVFR